MRPDTQRAYYYGANIIFAPPGTLDHPRCLEFEQKLALPTSGLIFDQRQRTDTSINLTRTNTPLQVAVMQQGPVVQLLITAPHPNRRAEDFIGEVETVLGAFREVWPESATAVKRDCTIRYLYAVQEQHSMQFLWERRLGHSGTEMQVFGRPVLGGGIRLVFPSRPDHADEPALEIKVESLLADPAQLFLEIGGAWESPLPPDSPLDVGAMLQELRGFVDGPVTQFLLMDNPAE